jgi:hypothetical protein
MAMQAASACDICGMGVSNNDPFLFPQLHKRYLAMNYLYRSYHITGDDGINSAERYSTWLLAAQFTLGKRVQLYASLPLQANSETDYFGKKRLNGLGDATLSLNYKLLDKSTGINSHIIVAGAGIKLPTGKNSAMKTGAAADQEFQLGTGSVDYTLNAGYSFRHKGWTLGASGSYKYNTQNEAGFRFGDIVTAAFTCAYTADAIKYTISPYVQVKHEWQMMNADTHVLQAHTGGNVLYTTVGSDINARKIIWGMAVQLAPVQHLAGGQVKVDPAFSTHVSFTF